MKALKLFALMAMLMSAPAARAQSIQTDWRYATYIGTHWFHFDYDFGSDDRKILLEIKEATQLDTEYVPACMSGTLTGDGSITLGIGNLASAVTYEVRVSEYWNGGIYYSYVISSVIVYSEPEFNPSDVIGGTVFTPIVSIQLNEYGFGFPSTITVLYAELENLDDGSVYQKSDTLPGNGSLSDQSFSFPGLPSGNYKLCFWLTYTEGGNTHDFGPLEIINSCDEGDAVYFYHSGISLDVPGGSGPVFTIVFMNGFITIQSDGAPGTYMICDVMGRVVVPRRSVGEAFDVSVLPSGAYVVSAFDSTGAPKAHQTYSIVR